MLTLNQLAILCQPSDSRFHVRTVKASNDTLHAFAAFNWNGDAMRDQICAMLESAKIEYRRMTDGAQRMIVVKIDL